LPWRNRRGRIQQGCDWLSNKPVIPGSRAIAAFWGDLSAAAIRRGRARPVDTIWIAVCCRACDLPFATLNLKDFDDFAEHHGLKLFGP
jgi:predicted nucleic acid-binding protein